MKINKVYTFFLFLLFFPLLYGQQLPFYPTSYRIFSPAIFNPAIAGSKDYSNITFKANVNGSHESQVLSGDGRLLKSKYKRWPSPGITPFSNLGIGGYLFHDVTDSFRNVGGAVSLSYHVPLSQDKVTHLSFGLAGKGIYSIQPENTENPDSTGKKKNIFTPDLDFGIYFYSIRFFAGVSSTNFLSNPSSPNFPAQLENTLSRQYFMTTGYKIILSRRRAIILEPSLIMNFGSSSFDKLSLHYHPALKLYYKYSYIGSYLNDLDNFSFFLHAQTPWFFVSTYVEFPYNENISWYNGKLNIELSVGIILGRKNTKIKDFKFW